MKEFKDLADVYDWIARLEVNGIPIPLMLVALDNIFRSAPYGVEAYTVEAKD